MMNLGKNIQYFRQQAGMSREQLGEMNGIDEKKISDYEEGILRPDINTVKKICENFDMTLSAFMAYHEDLELLESHICLDSDISDCGGWDVEA